MKLLATIVAKQQEMCWLWLIMQVRRQTLQSIPYVVNQSINQYIHLYSPENW